MNAENENSKFRNIIEILQRFNDKNKTLNEILNKKINEVTEVNTILSKNVYDDVFKLIENGLSYVENTKNDIFLVKNALEELIDSNKMVENVFNKLGKVTNENKFKYGLQGQLKKNKSEYLENIPHEDLTEDIQYVLDTPIEPTPYRGGKKTIKKYQKKYSKYSKYSKYRKQKSKKH